MTDYYTGLPDDLLYEIALKLNLKDLYRQCRISKRIASLCNNNNFWHQKYIRDLGTDAIDWQQEYINRLKRVDQSQRYWEQRYFNEFGDDINFKTKYVNYITNKIYEDLRFALYKARRYASIDDPKGEYYNSQIIDYFYRNPIALYAISLPGLEELKEKVRDSFRFMLRNYREQYPTLQQLYNEIFVW